ncbi:MAG: HAD-IA family hydrolase [Actinobacteria bacterium]|nr:HAD-IA family hydrolase [Actinomycetota bacterium]
MSALRAFGADVEAVFLDVGGVFHLPDHELIRPALRRAGIGDPVDDAVLDRAHYAGAKALTVWPKGDISAGVWAAYEQAYAREIGVPEDRLDDVVAELDAAFAVDGIWSRLIPGSMDGLRALEATGVTLAIVSNSDGTLEGRLRNEAICQVGEGAGVPMAIVIDSDVVGVAKPDPAIFRIALEATGVAPERALHIGDTIGADVNGALAAGVRPVHLDPYGFCDDDTHPHVRDLAEVAAALNGAA